VRRTVSDDPAGVAAERLAAAAGGHIALSGGSTPRAAYERAAAMGVDWTGTTFWFGDDRAVAPDHEHSNFRMARETLLDGIDGAAVERIRGELGHEEAAGDYERRLRAAFGDGLPRLDLVLLGLGPDAHTASLFPRDAALGESERLAVGVPTPGMAPLVSRVTLTLPVLNNGKEVVFLVAGEDKREAVHRAFSGARDPDAPASLVDADELIIDPAAQP
jgi:6-phosphogluconolactonase